MSGAVCLEWYFWRRDVRLKESRWRTVWVCEGYPAPRYESRESIGLGVKCSPLHPGIESGEQEKQQNQEGEKVREE